MSKEEISFGAEISPGVRIAKRRSGDQIRTVITGGVEDGMPLQPGIELASISAESTVDADGTRWHRIIDSYKHGPAQVATPAYRDGYDRIFGKKKPGQA